MIHNYVHCKFGRAVRWDNPLMEMTKIAPVGWDAHLACRFQLGAELLDPVDPCFFANPFLAISGAAAAPREGRTWTRRPVAESLVLPLSLHAAASLALERCFCSFLSVVDACR